MDWILGTSFWRKLVFYLLSVSIEDENVEEPEPGPHSLLLVRINARFS
jgi:hypothetical protein